MRDNSEAFKELAVNISTLYMKRSYNKYTFHEGTDLTNTVAFAMNLSPDPDKIKEGASGDKVFFKDEDVQKLDGIIEAIKSTGGSKPGIIVYPVLLRVYSKEVIDNVARLPIFCVRKNAKQFGFVDVAARVYENHSDFVNNHVFPPGIIAYPKNLHYTEDKDGNAIVATLETETAGRVALKVLDLGFSVMGIGAAALALTGVGTPIAIGMTIASTAYGVGRSTATLVDRYDHNQSLNPFSDWEAFGAWTGIGVTALGVGCTVNALRLSEKVSRLAAEGLRISTTTRIALHASVFIPYAVNAALMITQLIRMAEAWNNVPIEYKIIIGLQLLFFVGAALRLSSLTVSSIQDQVAEMIYNDVREMLAQEPDGVIKVATLNRMINEVGGKYNADLINSLRKIANYDNGVLFAASRDLRFAGFGTFEPTNENGEVGFRLSNRIYIGPEAAIQLGEDMRLATRDNNPGVYYSVRMPRPVANTGTMSVNTPVDQIIASRGLVNIEQVEQGRLWLQTRLNNMENMPVPQATFWNSMRYHEQMRLRFLPEIAYSLNVRLTNLCLRYAAGDKIGTVGQYVSRFEISSLVLHRRANDLIAQINAYKQKHNCTLAKAADSFGIQTTIATETRLTYNSLPAASNAFAENVSDKGLKSFEMKAMNVVGKKTVQSWKSSITISAPRVVNTSTASLQTLANDIVALGDLSYGKPEQLVGNCSLLAQAKSFPDSVIKQSSFPAVVLKNANDTIKSCRNCVGQRVVDVTRNNDKYRKLAFWDLEDGKTAKCTVVTIDKRNGQCRIQNFTTKSISTTAYSQKNLKEAILEYFSDTYTADKLKVEIDGLIRRIETECKDYVGAQLIRDWENHDTTVADIQNLDRVRFSSVEHAVCHVLKHGVKTEAEILSAIKEYFQKADEVIQYSKDHPECVSSEWTQTGSARDFIFYRPLPNNRGVEKVVVLVREGGEVIMKTYFEDTNCTGVPPQLKHVQISKLELKDANLQTFYFQMMFLTPRFGVLLPNNFEILQNDLKNKEMTRNIIIIAAHHFNEEGGIKAEALCETLDKTYPEKDNKWNVFAFKRGSDYAYSVTHNTEWYLYVRIHDTNLVIFLRDTRAADSQDRTEAIKKFKNLSKRADISSYANVTEDMRQIACRLVTDRKDVTDIRIGMNECFGQRWNVFRISKCDFFLCYERYIKIRHNGFLYIIFC